MALTAPEYPAALTDQSSILEPESEKTVAETSPSGRRSNDVKADPGSVHEESVPVSAVIDDTPDGGARAWLVVVGAMCNTFTTFGYINSWGVFQSYYQEHTLSTTSPSTIAWIGSLQYAFVFLPSLVSGRLFDLGYDRVLLLSCSVILVLATFLVAQCKEYWQFIICQGFMIGLASGGMMTPTISAVSHWFKRRRGLAFGLIAVGSSLGGTTLPILARNLIPRVGFPWTMRIIGFVQIAILLVASLTLRRRLPVGNTSKGLFNLAAFKNSPYTVYCASSFFTFLGIYTFLTYVDISATLLGISADFAFYLVAIANAGSGVGRFVAGRCADPIGAMNTMIPLTAGAGILTYAWPFAKSKGAIVAVSVLYGFCSGAYVALVPSPVMEFGELDDVGQRVGMMFSILAIGALAGPPISGAIYSATGGFEAVGYWAGSVVLVGVGLMCWARHLVLKRLYGKI